MNITREQAVYMFFGEEFNEVNKSVLVKRIDEMKDIDVCYIDDPTVPMYPKKSNFENNN
ncbi:uncharacterized protein BX663DRAFT_551574 [Cokeromyces recurvatus]|uniref:uncharacterized protein n=1 Tax=Cokeromyces recurvatus TaxID=90255 RepID=UPI00222017AE|nr:uncharacterized protein BX663DRAFT_551574 [Cokeromyces recurvatus]KAI7903278.1 hypothetical protein BX663DRAFT_551574 [Cokeromyces recurvatus]